MYIVYHTHNTCRVCISSTPHVRFVKFNQILDYKANLKFHSTGSIFITFLGYSVVQKDYLKVPISLESKQPFQITPE